MSHIELLLPIRVEQISNFGYDRHHTRHFINFHGISFLRGLTNVLQVSMINTLGFDHNHVKRHIEIYCCQTNV